VGFCGVLVEPRCLSMFGCWHDLIFQFVGMVSQVPKGPIVPSIQGFSLLRPIPRLE
jgi:hypothetical protein